MFDCLNDFLVDAISYVESVRLAGHALNFTNFGSRGNPVVAALGLDPEPSCLILSRQRLGLLPVLPLSGVSLVDWRQGEWSQLFSQLMNSLVILFEIPGNCRLEISFTTAGFYRIFISNREAQMPGRNQVKEFIVGNRLSRLLSTRC